MRNVIYTTTIFLTVWLLGYTAVYQPITGLIVVAVMVIMAQILWKQKTNKWR